MKNQIPEFLTRKFRGRSAVASKFPDKIKQFMFDYATFYEWNIKNDLQKIYLQMSRDISTLPKCQYPGCNQVVKFTVNDTITIGCNRAHSQKIMNLEKYGVENINQLESTKIKREKTCLKKFGETTNLKSKETKDKIKITNIEKYGVEYPMQSVEIRAKRTKTFQKKYGVDEITRSQHFKDICLERYGVTNPTLNAEILEKAQTNSYNRKEYIWETGEISIVQGYEPIVLKELENAGYKFHEVLTSTQDMPKIMYFFNGAEHRYFPDFYIPNENLIIEVKSEYTLQIDLEKNQKKFEATRSLGFDFRLEVR